MDWNAVLMNLTAPPFLLFLLGVVACWIRSDLEFPQPLPRILSIYLLLAIGYKGGVSMSQSGFTWEIALVLGAAVLMSALFPLWIFPVLLRLLSRADAAAVAACYGSISAVTLITAMTSLQNREVPFGGYMVAAMALMETPALVVGLFLAESCLGGGSGRFGVILHEATCNAAVVLLLGGLLVGWFSGPAHLLKVKPFTHELFYGILGLFLSDMGLVAARRAEGL